MTKQARRSSDVEDLVTHATTDTSKLVEERTQEDQYRVVVDDEAPTLPSDHIDPLHLLGASVLLGLLLSLPSLLRAIDGRVALYTAAWYFGWAVGLSALGTWLLWAVWHAYRRPIDEQRRRDWEQARAERRQEIDAERAAADEARRHSAERMAAEEAAALRSTAPPSPVDVAMPKTRPTTSDDGDAATLPRSLRESLEVPIGELAQPVTLSDPQAGSR